MINPWNKIAEIRSQSGLSQVEFAKTLGYSKGYVANIETERTKPSRRFLEAISNKYNVSMDWLFQESQIIDLIEWNKQTDDPDLMFVYAFTQKGIDEAEKYLKNLLKERYCIFVDAAGVKSLRQLLIRILNKEGRESSLWHDLEDLMLFQEVILVIKNMSSSKIPNSGSCLRGIFKILDDTGDLLSKRRKNPLEKPLLENTPTNCSLIALDFPSYLEKNMQSGFGYYAFPIHVGDKRGHNK